MQMPRNRYHPPGHQFTVVQCEKCGDWYEASYEHICKQVNSYALKIDPRQNVYTSMEIRGPKKKGKFNGHT